MKKEEMPRIQFLLDQMQRRCASKIADELGAFTAITGLEIHSVKFDVSPEVVVAGGIREVEYRVGAAVLIGIGQSTMFDGKVR